jgi:hypothetical protein
MNTVYEAGFGRKFEFNDPVKITCVLLPEDDCIGRLIQVRKAVGAYGSDILIVRNPNENLRTFENVSIEPYTKTKLPICEDDSIDEEYTIKGNWGEVGFIIEKPKQPESHSPAFGIAITKAE